MINTKITPHTTRVGWMGTGVMGQSMCGHLIRAGFTVKLTTRTRTKADALVAMGGQWCETPAEVAQDSDIIVTMVGFPHELRELMFGADGVLRTARPGAVLVDMTTSQPALAREIYQAAKSKHVYSLDAPVSGGDVGAREAHLSIMIGGDQNISEALEPFWNTLGRSYVYQGSAGAGQHTKVANQILVATGIIGVCEALLYAYKAGLNMEAVLKSVSSGAAGSWALENYSPRILTNNFEPGFFVEHFIKDLEIALAEAKQMNLVLPGLALAHQLYVALKAQGHGHRGIHALQLALASLSSINWMTRK